MSKRADLIVNDIKTVGTDFKNWKAKAIYFYDNNGNILELIIRSDLKNSSENPFTIENILNISEVGFGHDDPLKISAEVIEKTNIDYFKKGPKREDFVALGDDEGLFVISNPHRNWYPTKDRVQKNKVKTKIQVDRKVFDLNFN